MADEYVPYIEDFNKRRLVSRALIRTHFAEPWQWRVDIDGMPEELSAKKDTYHPLFELLAREISFGPVEFETEAVKAGGIVFTYPNASAPTTITMTMRDTNDRLVYDWITAWQKKIVNAKGADKGTFNLPLGKSGYCRKLKIGRASCRERVCVPV